MVVARLRCASYVQLPSAPIRFEQHSCVVSPPCSTPIDDICTLRLESAKRQDLSTTSIWTLSSGACLMATANTWPCFARLKASMSLSTNVKQLERKILPSSSSTRSFCPNAIEAVRHYSPNRARLSSPTHPTIFGALQLRHFHRAAFREMSGLRRDERQPSWT